MARFSSIVSRYPLLLITVIQLLLIYIAFRNFWLDPGGIIFKNCCDGLKNLFHLQAYVSDPIDQKGLYHLKAINYPWGEYVHTTDNTPGFAIPFRWFCQHIYNISDYAIPVYQAFIALSFVLSGWFSYKIFRRLTGIEWLSLVAALILPWTNFQTVRVPWGHFNLGLSFFILWALWAFIRWTDTAEEKGGRKYIALLSMTLATFTGFLFHGYYIAILGIFQGTLLLFYGFMLFRKGQWKKHIAASVGVTLLSVLVCVLFQKATDPYLSIRPDAPNGYDWIEQKIRFFSLFTAPKFYSFQFWIQNNEGAREPENMGYLGNLALWGCMLMGALIMLYKPYRMVFRETQRQFFSNTLLKTLFFAGIFMYIVNAGEYYYTEGSGDKGITLHNYLNPLLWAHLFTKQVEQFRSMSRFAWPFFWTFNIWAFYTLYHFWMGLQGTVKKYFWAPLLLLGALEVKDYVDFCQLYIHGENLLSRKHQEELKLPARIHTGDYQAALFLPYYNVGSEIRALILDDDDSLSAYSFRFYLKTRLPLMNVKIARSVTAQTQQVKDWFHTLQPGDEIRSLLNDKPILVIRDRHLMADSTKQVNYEETRREFMMDALLLPERAQMQAVDSIGNLVFYAWYPLGKPAFHP